MKLAQPMVRSQVKRRQFAPADAFILSAGDSTVPDQFAASSVAGLAEKSTGIPESSIASIRL